MKAECHCRWRHEKCLVRAGRTDIDLDVDNILSGCSCNRWITLKCILGYTFKPIELSSIVDAWVELLSIVLEGMQYRKWVFVTNHSNGREDSYWCHVFICLDPPCSVATALERLSARALRRSFLHSNGDSSYRGRLVNFLCSTRHYYVRKECCRIRLYRDLYSCYMKADYSFNSEYVKPLIRMTELEFVHEVLNSPLVEVHLWESS